MNRCTQIGCLFLAILMVVSTLMPTMTFAYSTIHGKETWLQSVNDQAAISQGQQALYFGVIEEKTTTGYKVKTIHMEISYGDNMYDYDQDADIIDVVVRNHTDVVTLNGTRKLDVQTPVVAAGYQQQNGSVEALVIGDMQTAEMIQPEASEAPAIEDLEADLKQDATDNVSEEEQTEGTQFGEARILSLNQSQLPATDKRYTSVDGDFSKSFQWKKNVPAFKVGSLLTISLYMEVFSGVEMNWDFPFEVQARLLDPIRYITWEDKQLRPGETSAERAKRLYDLKAMLRVGVEPIKHSKNRTLFAQAGVKLNVGFEGSIAGHSFNEKIDLLKLASGVVGGGGLSMQVGGKHAAPLFGEQATFGIRDTIGFDSDAVKCSLSCTIDLFTEDSVGISLPFFEAGIFTMGFEIQPLMLIYGDYPKIKQIETSPGLDIEAGYQYDYGLNHGSTFPVSGDTPIYPYDALFLSVNDVDGGPPPQLADENGKFDLSFKVDYKPRAMVGLFYQATLSAKKLGIGTKVKLPMMALPIPFDFDLNKIGGSRLSELSCTTKELKLSGCTEPAFQFGSPTIIQPIGLRSTELPEAVSGTDYKSAPIIGYGGTGAIALKAVGMLPGGLKLKRTGSDDDGNGIYQLVGKPNVKEGRYAIKLQASDSAGAKKIFELSLDVGKIYPERIDAELISGQFWSQQLKFVGADGTVREDVRWKLSGNLPASAYELGSNGALRTVPSALVPGSYAFTVIAELNDTTYNTGTKHRITVLKPDAAAERDWSVEHTSLGSHNALYGDAAWHEGLGQVALIAEWRGAMLYDGVTFNSVAGLPYPFHASMAYVYPRDPEESGWMYIFGGANKSEGGEFAGNVYKWDEDGVELLYRDPLDGSGPTVYDSATAALPDGKLLVFGGDYAGKFASGTYDPKLSNETWLFDPNTKRFTKVNSKENPGARSGNQIMTYVPELGKAVLFGENLKNKPFLPEEREQEIWLFDPVTLQWSKADDGNKLVLSKDEGTRLVYSRAEQKLFILISDTTPISLIDGQSSSRTRFYSIDVSSGQLGSLLDESGKLPQGSQSWGRSKGRLAYDEQHGSLIYLQDNGLSNTDIWSYALAQADSDRESIIADGQDRVSFQFNVTRYLDNPQDWRVSWQNIGHPNVLDGKAAVITTPDAEGNVALDVSYENYALTKRQAGTLLLAAEHVSDGRRVPIGFAAVGLVPVPPDGSNSVIELTPAAVDYLGDSWAGGFDSRQTQLTITLRSAGEYMDGASAENGDFKGKPLPGRKLELLDSLELENTGLRFYTGPVTDQPVGAADYDESKFLLDFEGYIRNVYTDEKGQVTLTLIDWPAAFSAGEHPFVFALADGSGFTLQHSLSVVPRQLKARQTAYQFNTWTDDWFSERMALEGLEDWHARSCSEADSFSCFKLVSGALPDGVSLNPQTGVISGMPKAKGIYVAGIRLPNRAEDTADVTFTIRVMDPLSLDAAYRNWDIAERVGEPFSYALDEQVMGGIGPFTYEIVEGALPPGIVLEKDVSRQSTGFLSGTFSQAYEGSAKVRITESGLPTGGSGAVTESRSVEKTLRFNIYPPERYATSFSTFDKVYVSSEANLWVSGLDGIPVGSPEGVFDPYGKNQYYELIRLATNNAAEFQLQYSEGAMNLVDDLVLYYWNPEESRWKKFHSQEFSYPGYSRVLADVSGEEELKEAWQRSEERFMNFYDYDRLYIAVGKQAVPTPVIESVSHYFSDEKGFEEISIEGRYFTEHPTVYVGGREALEQYISCSKGSGEDPEVLCLNAVLPPGYGTKDIVVIDRGGTSNSMPYTYASSHKFPAYDLELRMKVQSKQELDALESGNPYPDMLDNAQLITVELMNGEGERQTLGDVLLKGSPACESLDASEQDQCFDPKFTLTNWNQGDYSNESLHLTCSKPGSGQFGGCVIYRSTDGNLAISGTLNEDGTFQAMMNRIVDSCATSSCGGAEMGDPGESYPGGEIDLTISNEDGYYGRITGNAPKPERREYADEALDVTDMLKITTTSLSSIDLDDSPELYSVALAATGGRGSEHYKWYWGGESDIPPGIVLETESGELRASGQPDDPPSPTMKPGTYLVTIVVSDGIVNAARTFTLTIAGSPEQDVVLQDLVVHGGNPANAYPLSVPFDAYQSSYSLDVMHEEQQLYIVPTLGDYTLNGTAVMESEYEKITEVRVNGALVPQLTDGSYAVHPRDGWTHVSISALVKNGDQLVAARAYTVLIARTPSTELDRLLYQVSGSSEVTELQVQGNGYNLNISVPYDAKQIVVRPYQADPVASLEMVVDDDIGNGRILTSGAMTTPIELSGQPTTKLDFTLSATDRNGDLMQSRYTVNVNRVMSDDASLQQLAFTPDLLTEHFTGQSTLQGEVLHEQDKVQLLATTAHDGATMQVLSNGQIVPPGPDRSYSVPLQVGSNTVQINVTAENGVDTSAYTVQIERLASRNSTLASLQADAAEFLFRSELFSYEANVAYDVDRMNVTAAAADSGASLQVSVNDNIIAASADGSYSFLLRHGFNMVKLWVTAADGVSRQLYRLSVLRDHITPENAKNADNAQLQSIELKEATSLTSIDLDRMFAPDVYEYSASTTDAVVLRAIPAGDGAAVMVTIDDRLVAADDEGIYSFDAEIGNHIVDVYVASGDETKSSHYQIKLKRLDETDNGNDPDQDTDEDTDQGSTSEAIEELGQVIGKFGDAFHLVLSGSFPPGKLPEDLTVDLVDVPAANPGMWRITAGYEAIALPELSDQMNYTAIVKMKWNADVKHLPKGYEPKLFIYDHQKQEWVSLGGELQDGYIVAYSDQLGIFAGFLVPGHDAAARKNFNDIDQHWAAEWIRLASSLGLTDGYPDGSFKPQRQVNRLEFIAMLLRLTGDQQREEREADETVLHGEQLFSDWSDIPEWGAGYAAEAIRTGIVQGYPDGTFRPLGTLTRVEMMTMIDRALKLPKADPVLLDAYRDKDEVPVWGVPAVAALLQAKYVQGSGNGYLQPLATTTRAEIVKILVEAYIDSFIRG
ncbi:cadherin-like beta sandwich domain-containing protein [Paenibacillus sp. IITD108]|uniref:cadherin-like beta sandwich domain-containing protein n=1 Tax=Paenibacillus sp. IITD108 TaxID=3116649 RepID=UPI002F41ECD9